MFDHIKPFLPATEKVEQRLGTWCSVGGFLLAAVADFGETQRFAETIREGIYATSLVLLTLGTCAFFLATRARLHRKARYAEVFSDLRRSLEPIAEHFESEDVTRETAYAALQECVDACAKTFTDLSGNSCRCCIKVVRIFGLPRPEGKAADDVTANVHLFVETLRRSDGVSTGERHLIASNTDFSQLWQDAEKKMVFRQ